MATMQFRVSQDEFVRIVKALQQILETDEEDEEKVEIIISFFQEFMIDMDAEDVLGFYNYELIVDGETIRLDENEIDERLKELVKAVMVP